MKKPIYAYPGSFCPPTYGHVHIAIKAAELFPEVVVVCSNNESKTERWFTEEECVAMWSAYSLPSNIRVVTFARFLAEANDPSDIVMIRGIRDESDFDEEKKVALLNKTNYGIDKFFYIFSAPDEETISSSRARLAATALEFETLADCVAPLIVSRLLAKALSVKESTLVIGYPEAL